MNYTPKWDLATIPDTALAAETDRRATVLFKLKCKRCNWTWPPRGLAPKQCPKCRSPYWNKERVRGQKTVVNF